MHLTSLLFLAQVWLVFSVQCKQEEDCNSCFSKLLLQTTHHAQNLLNLQNLFFPPEDSPPSLVTVFYHYEEENGTGLSNHTEVWFWATSSFYFYHPPHIFLFTSLFFSDTNLQHQKLHLNLSYDCYNASNSFMMSVTEKLKVNAAGATMPHLQLDRSQFSSAVATPRSLQPQHLQHKSRNTYLFVHFIVFPILTYLLILFTVVHFTDHNLSHVLREGPGEREKRHHLALQNKAILSLAALMYILTLSSVSVFQTANISNYFSQEVSQYLTFLPLQNKVLQVMSSLSATTLALDAVVCVLALICLLIMGWTRNIWKYCAYSILFPLCCVANHLNYIIIAFIHNMLHAINTAAVYTLVGIFLSATLTHISYLVDKRIHNKNRHPMAIQLIVKMAAAALLCGYIAYATLFYILLPSRKTQLNSINVAIVAAISAAAVYFWTRKPQQSFLWILAEAETERRRGNSSDSWHRKTTREQEVAIARALLHKVLSPAPDKNCHNNTSVTLQEEEGNQQEDEGEGHQSGTSYPLHEIPASNLK